jgi:hypothetical protein
MPELTESLIFIPSIKNDNHLKKINSTENLTFI